MKKETRKPVKLSRMREISKSAVDGKFISAKAAAANPRESYQIKRARPKKKAK